MKFYEQRHHSTEYTFEVDNQRYVDTVDAMLKAAGWQGTLEELNARGTKPSHYIRARMREVAK